MSPGADSLEPVNRFGVHSIDELRTAGMSTSQIGELVEAGSLTRVIRGWYAEPTAKSEVARAIRLGGRLGCLSGCRLHGLWIPPDPNLHVAINPGHSMPARQPGVEFHRAVRASTSAVASLEDCLAQVLQRHDPETGLVVLESAVNLEQMGIGDAHSLIASAPVRRQRGLHHFMPGAQSGSETRLRLFFQRLNVPVKPQAFIPGVGSVDLLVGKSWIVEADSELHHGARANQEVDRHRDLAAWELGYGFTRLTYHQIWTTWDHTRRILGQRIRDRQHMKPPKARQIPPSM